MGQINTEIDARATLDIALKVSFSSMVLWGTSRQLLMATSVSFFILMGKLMMLKLSLKSLLLSWR